MKQVSPYLAFDGQCEAAFKFYEQALGGKIVAMMTYGDMPTTEQMPGQIPADQRDAIVHARMIVGDTLLMGGDAMCHYQTPAGFSVSLMVDDPAEAERIFGALADGGKVRMPIEETFWAVRFGLVTDRFGTPWMINCERSS